MPRSKNSASAAALLAVVGFSSLLVGCGSSSDPKATTACSMKRVTLDESGAPRAGACPLNTSIEIDDTAFGRGKEVAEQVAKRVLATASGTLEAGGSLRVALVGRDADRDLLVYRGLVPLASETDDAEHAKTEEELRSALAGAVTAAFDPQKRQGNMTAPMRQLEDGAGSDLARGLRVAIQSAINPDRPSAAVLISDGWVNTPELVLTEVIGHVSPDTLAGQMTGLAGGNTHGRLGLLAMFGVGAVPWRYQRAQTSYNTDRLVKAWSDTCHRLKPKLCKVEKEL